MELYFKEKLSLRGKVEVTDQDGNVVYSGKRSLFTGNLTLKDKDGKKLITIVEKGGIFGRRFIIKSGMFKTVAVMKQKISLINQKFRVKKLDWDIKGNFTAKEYQILKGETPIAEIKRAKLVALLETYVIEIHSEEDAASIIAVALVLNQILGEKKSKIVGKVAG